MYYYVLFAGCVDAAVGGDDHCIECDVSSEGTVTCTECDFGYQLDDDHFCYGKSQKIVGSRPTGFECDIWWHVSRIFGDRAITIIT